ncbi:DUF5710 domain-containing protein [Streptosporangium sp. CA-135522]|uniref:DUF5710 domain-containing protein n=1 Tax=Streptosporangium sp. CA-135522 TaxID=3240072 RepID=UPI003D9454B7
MAVERLWLDVPYSEKDEAKALGARWDPAAKRWYAPRTGLAGLQRWAALPMRKHRQRQRHGSGAPSEA